MNGESVRCLKCSSSEWLDLMYHSGLLCFVVRFSKEWLSAKCATCGYVQQFDVGTVHATPLLCSRVSLRTGGAS